MTRVEALNLLNVLTSANASEEEKRIAALRLKEMICLLFPDE